ncbi:MAG: tetratricopeptide repeat-containing glycosyltransferase family protein [Verrucomicrobium sp.]|nr:tetratricopeptide repeat-containing glycosyltransferase family protein [Verrucomicrobium sp.]
MNKAVESLLARAVQAHQAGKISAARVQYQQVLRQAPQHPVALNLLGVTHLQEGETEKGLGFIDRALSFTPRYAEAWCNRSAALKALGRHLDAAEAAQKALALNPEYPEALNNLGAALHELRRYGEAAEACRRAVALRPGYVDAWSNLGSACKALRRYPEAEAAYARAIALQPSFADAHHNLGAVLEETNRHDAALASYERALAAQPGHVEAAWSRGLLFLSQGRLEEGWRIYERRWERKKIRPLHPSPWPLWLGETPLEGKRLLIQYEQGFGDFFQMARYFPQLQARGARCFLQVPEPLRALAARNFPEMELLGPRENPPEADCRIPFMSLPRAFGGIPAATPYLAADPAKAAAWRARLGEGDFPRVGLVWRGNPEHANDHNRSARLADFLPLLARPDVQCVVLQKDLAPEEAALLARYGNVAAAGPHLADFDDTAAVISLLDRVISIDSAVAHLAGALGRPLSLLLPFSADWRWGIGRAETPWYPAARLFRQGAPGQWNGPVAAAAAGS